MTESVQWEKFSRDQFDAGYAAGYGAAMDDGWGEPGHIKEAVTAALDAAWEAVAAFATERELNSPSGLDIGIHAVLHAIDALREEKQ